ncbi:dihydrofolate reductase [Diaminobutyricibacter sp. McL0618]|uniref:dihydrofolate reductase n=1 Tax=Leifsonia sp. McL0618 TaxID=3415677 RepID=UPI003CE75128
MSVALIWAEARGGVIGAGGTMPWHLPEDLAHFRAVTGDSTVVMGRRTWESLPERFRPLPGRQNIVVTRQAEWRAEGASTAHSLDEAITASGTDADATIWVIGGAELYASAITRADRLDVTEIDLDVEGDTFAPTIGDEWTAAHCDPPTGWHVSRTGLRYRFVRYELPKAVVTR